MERSSGQESNVVISDMPLYPTFRPHRFYSMFRIRRACDFGAGLGKKTLCHTYMSIQYMCAVTFYGSVVKC